MFHTSFSFTSSFTVSTHTAHNDLLLCVLSSRHFYPFVQFTSQACFPLLLFLLLQQLIMFLPRHHHGDGEIEEIILNARPDNMLPWACSPIPPFVQRLTPPPASWYAAWWRDLHQGASHEICASLRECLSLCVQTTSFFCQWSRSSSRSHIWSRAQIEAFTCTLSFTWCLNWNPHEILRMNENGGIGLTLYLMPQWPWLLCVADRSSQKIFVVVT